MRFPAIYLLALILFLIFLYGEPAHCQRIDSGVWIKNELSLRSIEPENVEKTKLQSATNIEDSQEEDEKHEQEHSGHDIPGVGLSIMFIFGSLLYGAILKVFARFTTVPYNPMLLISGVFLGLYFKDEGMMGKSIQLISSASSSGILAVLLPILIFESSFKTQWHIFKKLAGQSLILGILSTLVSATIITFMVKFYLDSQIEHDWDDAFMMGILLSCTDILSFVNRLKRTSAPQKITALLQGESLFNYCTCVLIIELMHYYKEVKETASFLDYLNLFLIEVAGGIVFGIVMGMIAVYCIKRMIYDGILVVTLIVIFTYAVYLFAEFSTIPFSGIISLAVFALYMNAFGKTWLFGQTQQIVSDFWSYLVFVAETSIFMIAGVIVGSMLEKYIRTTTQLDVQLQLYPIFISTLSLYLATVVARFLSIAVFIRYLRRLAEGLNWREIILLTFAGLKGAIGITLAIQIFQSGDIQKIASIMILINVTCNSIITFAAHGTSVGLLVSILGLSSFKKVQYKFFKQYLYSFKANTDDRLKQIKKQEESDSTVQWEVVDQMIGVPKYDEMIKEIEDIIDNGKFTDESKIQKTMMFKLQNYLKDYSKLEIQTIQKQLAEKTLLFDLEVQFRKRFIKDLIAKYWQFHDSNQTSPAALMLLIQSANYDLDREAEQIQSWNWIKNEVSFNMHIYSSLMKVTFINSLAKSSLFDYVSFCYDVVSSYIKANEIVRQESFMFYQKSEHISDNQITMLENILRQSEENQKQAQLFLLNYLEPSFPEIQQEVKTRKVSFFILNQFKDIIDENNENGQLEPNQYELLDKIIHHRSLDLNLASVKWVSTPFLEIITDQKPGNVFNQLPEPILELISKQLNEEDTYDRGQKIIDNGELAKYFYFVKKGGCKAQFTSQKLVYKQSLLAGQVFGFESLVTNIYHSKVTTKTMAQIVKIKKSLIIKIFNTFPKVEQAFWKTHIFECYKMFHGHFDAAYRISQLQREHLQTAIQTFNLTLVQPGILEDIEDDMIFVRGNIEVVLGREEKSVLSPTRVKRQLTKEDYQSVENLNYPFYFVSRLMECSVKIKEPSLFLIGQVDYEMFELESIRSSRNGTSVRNIKKKVTST